MKYTSDVQVVYSVVVEADNSYDAWKKIVGMSLDEIERHPVSGVDTDYDDHLPRPVD